MEALDVVNSNLAGATTESWAVYQTRIETLQQVIGDRGDSGLQHPTVGRCSTDMALGQTSGTTDRPEIRQTEDIVSGVSEAECAWSVKSDTSASSIANDILCPTADLKEVVAVSGKSTPKSAASSTSARGHKSTATKLFSDSKHPSSATPKSKNAVGSQSLVLGTTPKKTENASRGMKVGLSSDVTQKPSLTSRGSFDISGLRLSSRVTSKPTDDSTFRRPSVPKRVVKQHSAAGTAKQSIQTLRKSSIVSTSSVASGQKTASESSLAAGDFDGDLLACTSLQSSTPLTSSLGDSNSVSRVSSISDASSPPGSHASNGAFPTSAYQSPKLPTSTGKLKI